MKINLFINNQKGGMAALLSVIVLSMIMVMSLTATYSYLQNQSRYQAFVKANYQMGFTSEAMGQAVLQAFQQAQSGTCPTADLRYLDCTQICMPEISSYPSTTTFPWGTNAPSGLTNALCVQNSTLNQTKNNADTFCAYNMDSSYGKFAPTYCNSTGIKNADNFVPNHSVTNVAIKGSKLDRWYARLDKFFDTTTQKIPAANAQWASMMGIPQVHQPTMWGWLLPEKTYAEGTSVNDAGTDRGSTKYTNSGDIEQYALTKTYALDGEPHPGCDPEKDHSCQTTGSKVTMGSIQCLSSGGGVSDSSSCKKCGAVERTGCSDGSGACKYDVSAKAWKPDTTAATICTGTCQAPTCVDIAMCPPWISNETCMSQAKEAMSTSSQGGHETTTDPRYHKTITLN